MALRNPARPKRAPRRLGLLSTALGALAVACGAGHSQNPVAQYNSSQLQCLVTLQENCCGSPAPQHACVSSFAAAQNCAAWPTDALVTVFSTPCGGNTAVRAVFAGEAYSTFYVYDASGALLAIGDNATTPDPRSGAISCGAGPAGFTIPSACGDAWLGTTGSQACGSGAARSGSVCH